MRNVLLMCLLLPLIRGFGNPSDFHLAETVIPKLSGLEDDEQKERMVEVTKKLVLEIFTGHVVQTAKHNDTSAPADTREEDDGDVPILEAAGSLTIPAVAWPTCALSPDHKRLASPLKNDRIAVWNLTSGEQELKMKQGHDWQIKCVAFSPDGLTIATASMDKTAKIWDSKTGDLLATLEGHTDRLEYVTYSTKGKYLLTSTGKTWPYEKHGPVETRIWNATTGELVAELQGHTGTITHAEFSQDETRVLTASDDHTARLWDPVTGREVHKFELESKVVTALFGPDDKTVLTSSSGSRNLYVETEMRQRRAQTREAESVVKLWNAMTGQQLLDLRLAPVAHDPLHGAHRDVRASSTSGGDQILIERRGQITYWDVPTGEKLATLRKPSMPPPTVVFSPNGEFFAVLNRNDQLAELWHVAEKRKVREMEVPFYPNTSSLRGKRFFSPDEQTFYSIHEGDFRWWSLSKLK